MAGAAASGHVRLVQRKRGSQWYLKYRLPSGKQVQQRLGPAWTERSRPPAGYFTRRSSEEALRAILVDAQRGELPDPGASGRTFGDAVAEWLRYTEHDRGRKASTLRDYRNTANGALTAEFGADTPLETITAERIDNYRTRALTEGKLSRRSIQKQMVLLHGILKRAKAVKWIQSNPADDCERVSVPRSGEFNVLTVEQVEAVVREADGQYAAAIVTAAYTGLRTGELRALRWRDLDFAGASVHVRRNIPTHGEEGTPKSGKVRSVPLADDAARALDALSRRPGWTEANDRVFCNEVGERLREDALRAALYEAMEAAGIDRKAFPAHGGFTFHDLRHTFGTLAAQAFPLHDVQAFMGHADIQTTMRYLHHVPKRDAAARFSDLLAAERDVSRTVSRTAENGTELSATTGTEPPPSVLAVPA